MSSWKIGAAARRSVMVLLVLAGFTVPAAAQNRDRIRIPVGRAEVVSTSDEVRTVAIAEPKVADAAVGSARTVVVNAKAPGVTTLVIYGEGARFKVYDIEVFVPNGDKQVALHVRVAEVNENAKKQLGFDFYGEGTSNSPWIDGFLKGGILTSKIAPVAANESNIVSGLSVGPATDGFVHYQKNNSDLVLQMTWKALEETGDLRTLATPTLVARSGEKASFLAGGELPVPIASTATAGQSNVTVEWKEFGVRLNFTPTVEENSSITLAVAPELSQLDFSGAVALSGFAIPTLISRKTSTTVSLKSGEHLVISGLKQVEKTKIVRRIPILGHIPLVGLLFTNTRTENVDRDLLVVVSPEIIEGASTSLPALPTDR